MTTEPEYLLDTNACIAIRQLVANRLPLDAERLRKIEAFRQKWQATDAKALAMSLITLGELEFGAAKSRSPEAHAKLAALCSAVTVLLPDAEVARCYGQVRLALEAQKQPRNGPATQPTTQPRTNSLPIGPNDSWIAAHGLARELTVVTDNVREFSRVPGLKHENWMA